MFKGLCLPYLQGSAARAPKLVLDTDETQALEDPPIAGASSFDLTMPVVDGPEETPEPDTEGIQPAKVRVWENKF